MRVVDADTPDLPEGRLLRRPGKVSLGVRLQFQGDYVGALAVLLLRIRLRAQYTAMPID